MMLLIVMIILMIIRNLMPILKMIRVVILLLLMFLGVGSDGAFGSSVDLAVDEIAIGAKGVNSEGGRAYVYQRADTQWNLKWIITAADSQTDAPNSCAGTSS